VQNYGSGGGVLLRAYWWRRRWVWMAAAGAKTMGAAAQGQQVTLQRVFSPTVTDEDIALLRKDVRAMKMQVIVEPRRI